MDILIRAGSTQGFIPLMRSLGHDPTPLLMRVGLPAEALAHDDQFVPLQAIFDLMALSAELTGLCDFGLRAAAVQDIRMLGPLALALQNCPTVGEAMGFVARYLYVQSPALSASLHRPGTLLPKSVEVRYDPTGGGRVRATPPVYDHGLAISHLVYKSLAMDRYELQAVSLPHTPPTLAAHERFFGVPIHTAQPHCALHFAERMLTVAVNAATATFLKMATDYIDRNFPTPGAPLAARVHLVLSHALGNRYVDKASVAGVLAMHPRTLQRRLEAEGTRFEQIRDQVRVQATIRYLADSSYPLAQIASLVGFTEQSTFTRFCRQKLGATPASLRARRASSDTLK